MVLKRSSNVLNKWFPNSFTVIRGVCIVSLGLRCCNTSVDEDQSLCKQRDKCCCVEFSSIVIVIVLSC